MTTKAQDALFLRLVKQAGLPKPEAEYKFHPTRKWRFDFAWPGLKLAVEVDGGTWAGGRHSRGQGYEDDCVKLNEAVLAGWRVLRVTPAMIHDGRAVDAILFALDHPQPRTVSPHETALLTIATRGRTL